MHLTVMQQLPRVALLILPQQLLQELIEKAVDSFYTESEELEPVGFIGWISID